MGEERKRPVAKLVVVRGDSAGVEFRLQPSSTIGRDPDNAIRMLDERTSRHHAVIRRSEGAWVLQDLHSRNGTSVAGEFVTKPTVLLEGMEIRIGENLFRFECPSEVIPAPSWLELPDHSSIQILNTAVHHVEIGEGPAGERLEAGADGSGKTLLHAPLDGGPDSRVDFVFRIQKALCELREMDDLANTLLDLLFQMVPAHRGAVLVARPDQGIEPVAIRAPEPETGETRQRIPISRTLLRHALANREAVLMTDALVPNAESVRAHEVQSAISAPLVYQDRLLGILHLENHRGSEPFTREDLDLVATAASQAAIALANTRLLERIRRESEHRSNLQRYLAPGLVEQLADGKLCLETEGATRQCTVLFCDLRGFTSMSEWLPSKEVFASLNAFFQRMVDVIHAHRGSVDKFIGDAIMAVWGIPEFADNDAANAVLAAVKMQQELVHFNLERDAKGKPPLQMGIGIHSGPVLAGNLGARQRMEYTVIGDTVNLASRIERLSAAGQILVSEATMGWIRPLVDCLERPPVRVKGKRHPIKTFEVLGLRDQDEERSDLGRSHPRVKTSAQIVLISENGCVHEGLLADFSDTGAGVKILPEQMQGLEPGMTVRLPESGRCEPDAPGLDGTVARVILAQDPAGRALFKAGIRFLDRPERVREFTRGWLER